MKTQFATPRRTVIIDQEGEVDDEDLIQRDDMVVTMLQRGCRAIRDLETLELIG